MSKLQVLALIVIFLCPAALFADQIVLKNGDRLTGTIEKSDDKTLIIKTEFAGEVTVEWPAVQEITSTQALDCEPERRKDSGRKGDHPRMATRAVATANAGTVTEPKASVTQTVRRSGAGCGLRNHCTRACSKDGREEPTWALP